MGKSFLLRYQEQQVSPDHPSAHLFVATGTRIRGEQPDHAASTGYTILSNPRRDMETSTAVPSELPDSSDAGASRTARPTREAGANNTLTVTFVEDEAPRNDDIKNHSSWVLPLTKVGTRTKVRGEQPDRSAAGESCSAVPVRTAEEIVNSTLTHTFVRDEAPRKDERRRSALVLPTCS